MNQFDSILVYFLMSVCTSVPEFVYKVMVGHGHCPDCVQHKALPHRLLNETKYQTPFHIYDRLLQGLWDTHTYHAYGPGSRDRRHRLGPSCIQAAYRSHP